MQLEKWQDFFSLHAAFILSTLIIFQSLQESGHLICLGFIRDEEMERVNGFTKLWTEILSEARKLQIPLPKGTANKE